MRSTLFTSLAAFVAASTFAAGSAQVIPAGHAAGLRAPSTHRRHHASNLDANGFSVKRNLARVSTEQSATTKSKRASRLRKKRACKATSTRTSSSSSSTGTSRSSSSSSSSSDDSGSSSSSSNSTANTSTSVSLSSSFLSKNGIYWGYLPDEADAGGSKQTMSQLNQWTNSKSAFYGYYAQAPCSKTFDGSQLLSVKSDVVSSGAIFQPAVMPTGGFSCFTSDSSSNAYAIANVMKEFTDEGVEVWLRFGHEMNWYLQDGTYQGDASGFISAWKAVAGAIKDVAPDVKMFWTPNIENDSAYAKYWPGADYVDVVGIDYYPSSTGTFVSKMQNFHDTYAVDGVKFAIGETGLGKSADIATRLAYVEELTSDSTKSALPNYVGCSWFNFYKGYDFRIVTGDDSTTAETVSFFSS